MEEDIRILMRVQGLSDQLGVAEASLLAFRDTYRAFEYLWVKDIEECFQDFMASVPEDAPEGTEPTLEAFNAEIAKYAFDCLRRFRTVIAAHVIRIIKT